MQKALQRVSPENRLMEPGLVWLMLIPCLNFVWQFFIASRVPDSVRKEYQSRGLPDPGDCGKSLGLIFCSLVIVLNVIDCVTSFSELRHLAVGELNTRPGAAGLQAEPGGYALLRLVGLLLLFVFGFAFWTRVVNAGSQLDAVTDHFRRDVGPDLGDYDRPFQPGPPQPPTQPPDQSDAYRPEDPRRL